MKKLIKFFGVMAVGTLWLQFASVLNVDAAADMNQYCNVPPFVAQTVPPLVLLTTGRDHKLYYEAFNDAMDLDEDGRVDVGYRHNIDYYGYYDVNKCYTYNNTTGLFSPAATTTDKFCTSNQWSGNILNFMTMSRMDVMRKVLYGGHRSTDTTTSTILERVYIPGEAHSWAKEITGRLCQNGSTYTNLCNNNSDCDSGFTCVDKSQNLIGMNASDSSVCPAKAVTWSSTTNGKIMVAQFAAQAGGAVNGPTHTDLLNTFYTDAANNTVAPLSLVDMSTTGNPAGTSSQIKYISDFNDSVLNPENNQTDNTNFLAVVQFTTPNNDDSIGLWQFAVDGDDGVEVEILPSNKIPSNPANWIVSNYYGSHPACFTPSATTSPNNKAFCSATQSSEGVGYFNLATIPTGKVCSKKTTKSCATDAGCTLSTEGRCVNGGIQMAKNTKYYMIVRQTNGTGLGGVRVWYRRPKDASNAWSIFGSSTLTLSSPTIAPGNECSIRFKQFVDKADTTTGENRRHLVCSTTRSFDGATAPGVAGAPLLRFLANRSERMWNWASKERPVCADVIRKVDDSGDTSLSVDSAKSDTSKIWDYTVRVEVCKSAPGLETNCRPYTNKSTGVVTYKPSGLLQKYGEGDGTKVCSRTYSKTCTTDSDCTNNETASPPVREGLCIERAPMYFGLMTDSYVKNLSGGVLRKDIWSLGDEINMDTGQFIKPASYSATDYNSTFPQGSIIQTYETLRTVGFQYSDNSYQDNSSTYNKGGSCGWIVNKPLGEGQCRMWGNPIAEMMYEGLRYLAGKTDPTATFIDTTAQDGALPLYRQDWGIVRGSTKYRPYGDKDNKYGIFPICSKPFMLVMSDENVSYDSDSLPGSKFNTSFAEDSGLPQLNINVGTLLDTIGDTVANGGEGINGSTVFVGETTSTNNFMCTPKTATAFSLIRGLCPEEPTKQGSYYAAAVAYYGKTLLKTSTEQKDGSGKVTVQGKPNATTYSLVMGSPVPKMTIAAGGKTITLVPVGKSFSGGGVENSCSSKCTTSSINAEGSLVISGCTAPATASTAGSFCPSNQIVDFYVDTMLYDNNNAPPYSATNPAPSITYAKFRINFEDVEQGADHDMDAIATYEICTGSTCSPAIASNQVKVTVTSDYSAGGIDQVMGFVISGTTEDDTYLVVRDDGVSTGAAVIGALPLSWDKTFTVSSAGSTANLLKSPLWYAAKWGAFKDGNNNSKPDLAAEWDKDANGVPDNYYLVVNPLKLEQQLDKALTDILASTSSGTAASIVNKRQESGANLLTAVFYPEREFKASSSAAGVKVKWVGDLQNYWYYFDPFFSNSGLVEDTAVDNKLNLLTDRKVDLVFNADSSQTTANLYTYDGKNYNLSQTNVNVNDLKALWKAGDTLFARTAARTIYTNTPPTGAATGEYTVSFLANNFADINKTTLKPYLQSPDDTDAGKIITYTHGTDITGYRNRTITYNGITNTWKLGDIVSSTPKIQSSIPINNYGNAYGDKTYNEFVATTAYKNRNAVYVGANDGMLHAFSLGKISAKNKAFEKAAIAADGSNALGGELWAYIPSNALPYLRYLADPNYEHIFTVDLTSTLVDASLTGTGATPENEIRTVNSWKTLLIGGMGLGGGSRAADGTCVTSTVAGGNTYADCIKAPINSAGYKEVGLSSYFALDVTTPASPSLKWEFSRTDLGLALLEPAIVRVNGTTTVADTKNTDTNGKWFAVFVSGPTGPINTTSHQFYGRSDQTLKLFVVELATGKLVRTFDITAVDAKISVVNDLKNAKAFGSSLFTNAIDLDEGRPGSTSYYSTDVVYIGYTRQKKNSSGVFSWDNGSDGGLLRLLTNNSADPANWTLTSLIDSTGPVTASIAKMYDDNDPGAKATERPVPALWLYFGSGRYFYKDQNIDAADEQQYLFGLKEPCYKFSADKTRTEIDNTCALNLDTSCTTKNCSGLLKVYRNTTYNATTNPTSDVIANSSSNNLFDATLIEFLTNTEYENKYYNEQTVATSDLKKGWFAKLDWSAGDFKAERMITTPLVRTSGVTLFTTFKPTADICSYGGKTLMNLRHYRTGGMPAKGSMKGTVIVQLSTGAIAKTDLSKISDNPVVGAKPPVIDLGMGKPPSQPPQDDKPRKPIKKILHIQEK